MINNRLNLSTKATSLQGSLSRSPQGVGVKVQSTFCVSFTTVSQLFNSQEMTVIFSTPSMCRFRYVLVITEKEQYYFSVLWALFLCTFSNHSCATLERPTNITERMEVI